jgi:hypothetical protein
MMKRRMLIVMLFIRNMKNRNLFIELNIPTENNSKEELVNAWNKPLPMIYNLINSPALTHKLA